MDDEFKKQDSVKEAWNRQEEQMLIRERSIKSREFSDGFDAGYEEGWKKAIEKVSEVFSLDLTKL